MNETELLKSAEQVLSIGWGCPLEAAVSGVRTAFGSQMMGYINYFIPVSEMAAILSGWVIAIGLYYGASIVLRWVKAIS